MTKWNLSKLSDFQDTVTESYSMRPRRHRHVNSAIRQNVITFAVAVAAMGALTLSSGFSNATDYQITAHPTATTQGISATAQKPPLEAVFSAHSGENRITADVEKTLLQRLAQGRTSVTKEGLIAQTVESIW